MAKGRGKVSAVDAAVETVSSQALTEKQRQTVKESLKRTAPLSLKFEQPKIDAWRAAAKASGMSLTAWISEGLDEKLARDRRPQ